VLFVVRSGQRDAVAETVADVAEIVAEIVSLCCLLSDLDNVMQLQRQLQTLQRALDRERASKLSVDNKRRSLESQITELTWYIHIK